MHVWVPCGFMWPPTYHNQREGMREVSEYEQLFLTRQESVNSIIQTGSVKHESKGPIRPTG